MPLLTKVGTGERREAGREGIQVTPLLGGEAVLRAASGS
jgi:hypothetical protein